MDISGLDIGAFATAVGAIAKALHSDRVNGTAKKTLEERCAKMEADLKNYEERLDSGEARFDKQDAKFDRIFDKVSEIDKNVATMLGYLKGKGEK